MAHAPEQASPPGAGGHELYIKQVSEMTGIPPSTLRLWERQGLVAPGRTSAGYRVYSYTDVERCRRIRDLTAGGRTSPAVVLRVLGTEDATIPEPAPAGDGLGGRLRRLRGERGVSLRDLAAQTGMSASYISSIERGLGHPSVAALQKLTAALGTTLVALLGDEAADSADPVIRPGQRRRVNLQTPGVELEQLTQREDILEPSHMRIAPGAGSAEAYAHDGEEFIYVLEGRFELTLEGARHELDAGDAITFRSHRPHSWRNPGTTECTVIWVNTPPTF